LALLSPSELILQRREWKRNGKRVVCVVGVFDLLHPGHIRLLEQARARGDILVVVVQSDAHARGKKGAGRPIMPAAERAEIVAAFESVDVAVELAEERLATRFLKEFAPDILVEGSSASSAKSAVNMKNPARAPGIAVIHIPPEPGHSTSRLIERIKQLRA
jgi:D-beta-D-heptose 7-phosphate kinase/D-beta-D-heptose 1-phosphate adenosyltransferase